MNREQSRTTGDEPLSNLSMQQGEVGNLVRAFLGRPNVEDKEWLDKWFLSTVEKHYTDHLSNSSPNIDIASSGKGKTTFARPIKLKSMQIHYFRGFREGLDEIDLGGNLIVIEGKNSSGKTSLAEALEWLLSGSLSRREQSSSGNARELAQCIANRHRPSDKDTWVSATFAPHTENGKAEDFTLRRVLQKDYGKSSKATCSSVLYFNDKALNADDEKHVLDMYFAGVPPLLMQHTLRDFVLGNPKWRRSYFERLLRLDEMTELIKRAVISDIRIVEFPSPSDGKYFNLWEQLGTLLLDRTSRRIYTQRGSNDKGKTIEQVLKILSAISRIEFPSLLVDLNTTEAIITAFDDEQEWVRQKSFPLLSQLQPRRRQSNSPKETELAMQIDTLGQEFHSSWEEYEPTLIAVEAISGNNLAVSRAFEVLLNSGVIQSGKESQSCPLCAYESVETLSLERISTIANWNSVRDSEQASRQKLMKAKTMLLGVVKQSLQEFDDLFPSIPVEFDWDIALQSVGDRLREEAGKLRSLIEEQQKELLPFVLRGRQLIECGSQNPVSKEECELLMEDVTEIAFGLVCAPTMAKAYSDALLSFEDIIGMEAGMDPEYRLRECILACYNSVSSITDDLRWEHAKRLSQQELIEIRQSLISYRQDFLEDRRLEFNDGIESVWSSLRDESYSAFSKLHIPKPRGVGYPVEIELKALLDDSNEQLEVDALGVFSESQINALGIAAFVTRSRMLGHKMLIFDDPVQSMDEDHFYSFARELIPEILNKGFQVVLLTHNEAFARGVSLHNNDLPGYVAMETVHYRESGSMAKEGNRTVPQRLKAAERKLRERELDSAWTYIRLAIERLYTVTYKKYGPDSFDQASWRNLTAGDMWNKGAGEVIMTRKPDCKIRLKEIITMTAAGAHDKSPMGETEIRKSIRFLRNLFQELKVGG